MRTVGAGPIGLLIGSSRSALRSPAESMRRTAGPLTVAFPVGNAFERSAQRRSQATAEASGMHRPFDALLPLDNVGL